MLNVHYYGFTVLILATLVSSTLYESTIWCFTLQMYWSCNIYFEVYLCLHWTVWPFVHQCGIEPHKGPPGLGAYYDLVYSRNYLYNYTTWDFLPYTCLMAPSNFFCLSFFPGSRPFVEHWSHSIHDSSSSLPWNGAFPFQGRDGEEKWIQRNPCSTNRCGQGKKGWQEKLLGVIKDV